MNGDRRKDILALAFLAGAILLVFGTPALMGRSWLALPLGAVFSQPAGVVPSHPAFVAGVDNFSFPHFDWPARIVARQAYAAGELPGWNPYASLGVPLIGQYETQIFFPFEMVEHFLGLGGWQIVVLLRMFLAGVGAYLFVAAVSTSAAARLGGALFYAFSAYFLWFCSIPAFTTGAMLVPWLFWAVLALARGTLPALRVAARVGMIFGLMLLSGQPQLTALAGLGCALFVVLLLIQDRPLSPSRWLRCGWLAVLALVIALLVSAPQVVSFLQLNRLGYSLHSPGTYGGGGISFLNLTIALWPYLLGQAMNPWDPKLFPGQLNWEAFPVLLGASGLLLGLLGSVMLFCGRTRGSGGERGVALTMLVLAVIVLAVPLSDTLGYPVWTVAGLNQINFPRYIVPVLTLCVATLLTFALQRLDGLRRAEVTWSLALALAVILACCVVVRPVLVLPADPALVEYFKRSLVLGAAPFLAAFIALTVVLYRAARPGTDPQQARVAVLLILGAELWYFVRYGFDTLHELWRIPVVVGVCLAALCLTRFPRAAWVALVAFALAPLVLMATAERAVPHRLIASAGPSELAKALQKELGPNSVHGRMIATQGIWIPNFGNVFGVAQLESLAPVQLRDTAEIVFKALTPRTLNYTVPNAWPGMSGSDYPSWEDYVARRAVFNLLGVRFLVDHRTGWLSSHPLDGVVAVWRNDQYVVYRDDQARPRAYLVAFPEDGPRSGTGKRKSVLGDLFELASAERVEGGVQVRRITPGSMQIDVRVDRPALLVIADAYYPGWSATVDGATRTVERVAGGLRGVFVRPGDQRVDLRFEQQYLRGLLWLSAGALALATLAAFSRVRRGRGSLAKTGA